MKVSCANPSTARKLASVLAPDNKGVPADQRFSMKVHFRVVSFAVESQRLPSVFATLQSILRDLSLFAEIWLISRGSEARRRVKSKC